MASAETRRQPTSGSRGPQSEYIDGILRNEENAFYGGGGDGKEGDRGSGPNLA